MGKKVSGKAIDTQRREKLAELFKGIFVLGIIFAFPFFAKKAEENKPRTAVWG